MPIRKILFLTTIVIIIPSIIILFLYLSGIFFLFFAKIKDFEASVFTILEYKKYYSNDAYTMKLINTSFSLAAIVIIIPVFSLLFIMLKKPKRDLYGRSRLATKQEAIQKLSDSKFGVLCGYLPPKYLLFGGTQHILMEAPTRSGKGVGFVIPNCLNYNGSIVVLDIKGENFDITSKYRELHGNNVYMFNPAPNAIKDSDGSLKYYSHRWNFLGYISNDENERINDIQKIASFLYPDGNSDNAFFMQQGRSVFLAIVLYLFNTPDLPITPAEIYRQSLKLAEKDYFKKECEKRIEEKKNLIPDIAYLNFKAFSSLSENTASSVMGTVTARLELWANPIIDATTSANDFDLRKIRKEKMSIYFVVTPDNIDRFAFLINLFFQQVLDLNLRELPEQNPEIKHPCLILLDEFTAIGKIPSISKGIAYFSGYWLRLAVIIQSVSQLTAVYGQAIQESFCTNLALRIVFAPKENKIAQEISESLGYVTEANISTSTSKNKGGSSKSHSESVVKRAILWPHELKEIGSENQILILDDIPPVMCKKIRYYKDKTFMDRLRGKIDLPSLVIPKRPKSNFPEKSNDEIEKNTVFSIKKTNYNYENEDLLDFMISAPAAPEEKKP